MITEKQIEKHKFFTTDGTDMWRVTHVKTLTVVDLVNCETGKTAAIRLGEQSSVAFVPVTMPKACSEGTGGTHGQDGHATSGRGVRKGLKRGSYKTKKTTLHTTGTGIPKGKTASSQYHGVTVKQTPGGRTRYIAQINNAEGYKNLGRHNIEELAAAAVQEYLGNKEEAARLRKLAEQKTDREIAELKEETQITAFDCKGCGAGYKYKPDVCGKCGGSSFTPARAEEEVKSEKGKVKSEKEYGI